MRIFWEFAAINASGMSASNTAPGYSVDNLKLNTLGTIWKSDAVTSTAQLLVDFGTAVSHDSFAFLGHSLTPGVETVTLKYASNAAITADVVTISHTLTAENWIEYFTPISRQYIEVVITKFFSTDQVYGGRLLSGVAFEPTYGVRPGYFLGPGKTTTMSTRTKGAQKYSSLGETMVVFRGTFSAFPDADYDEFCRLQIVNSTGIPFVMSMDWENHPTRKSLYGTLDSITPPTNVAVNLWEWQMRMTEQK